MPIVKQLSIFLENKPGVLARLCETFSENKINIHGLSVSDTVDHAVVRLITSDPHKASSILEDAGVLVVETDVLALTLPDKPGQLANIAKTLSKNKVNIEYAYGTTEEAGGTLILRVSDIKKAQKVLKIK
ncbi:MAG TPA: ACT domain-containing protein [Planctomycetota bacterium]|nr:ACT domain-containing protein [Planctomycetota bacterium]